MNIKSRTFPLNFTRKEKMKTALFISLFAASALAADEISLKKPDLSMVPKNCKSVCEKPMKQASECIEKAFKKFGDSSPPVDKADEILKECACNKDIKEHFTKCDSCTFKNNGLEKEGNTKLAEIRSKTCSWDEAQYLKATVGVESDAGRVGVSLAALILTAGMLLL